MAFVLIFIIMFSLYLALDDRNNKYNSVLLNNLNSIIIFIQFVEYYVFMFLFLAIEYCYRFNISFNLNKFIEKFL